MIDAEKWKQVPFPRQMGNIASEISRAAGFSERNDVKYLEGSLLRTLELIEHTIDAQKGTSRVKELCRLKEVVSDWLCGTDVYQVRPRSLVDYALQFSFLKN